MTRNIINLLFVSSFLFTGCGETKKGDSLKNTNQTNQSDTELKSENKPNGPKEDFAIISTSYGDMTIQFFEGAAPKHVESQFFICATDVSHLNGKYTVFGQVIDGDEIIDQIINLPRDARDNPNRRVEMNVRIEQRDK